MSFSVVIPARLASSRLPEKALADIAGLPMVVRVAQRAALSSASRVVVATDSEAILDVCSSYGVEAVMTDAGHSSGTSRIAEVCRLLGFDGDDLVVNVQGDEPLISPALIDRVARVLLDCPAAAMGTAAHVIDSLEDFVNPNVVKLLLDSKSMAMVFSRAPIPWDRSNGVNCLPANPAPLRHIGIYSYRASFLRGFDALEPSALEVCESLEQLRALFNGFGIAVFVSDEAAAMGVDTFDDLEKVRRLFKGVS